MNKENSAEYSLDELKERLAEALFSTSNKDGAIKEYITGVLRYFYYIDVCLEYLREMIPLVMKVYEPDVFDDKLSEQLIKKLKKSKRHITGGQKPIVEELQSLNKLVLKNVIPHFYTYIEGKTKDELLDDKFVYDLFCQIQQENGQLYRDINDWVKEKKENGELKRWPDKLFPNKLDDEVLADLTEPNKGVKTSYSKVKEDIKLIINYGQITLFPEKNSGDYPKDGIKFIDPFYEKLMPYDCLKLPNVISTSIKNHSKDKNLITLTEQLIKTYAASKSLNFYRESKKELVEKCFAIPTHNHAQVFGKKRIDESGFDSVDTDALSKIRNTLKPHIVKSNIDLFVKEVVNFKLTHIKHSKIKGYLKYIDQVCFLGGTRNKSAALPLLSDSFHFAKEEKQSELGGLISERLVSKLPVFLRQTWGDCTKQVYKVLIEENKNAWPYIKTDVMALFTQTCDVFDCGKERFNKLIDGKIKEKVEAYDSPSAEFSILSEMLNSLNAWTVDKDKNLFNEIKARTWVRLFVDKCLGELGKDKLDMGINSAIDSEIACLIQEFFSGYLINIGFSVDELQIDQYVLGKWLEYQRENIAAFQVLVMFLIEHGAFKSKQRGLQQFIDDTFKEFLVHRNRPSSFRAFLIDKDSNDGDTEYDKYETYRESDYEFALKGNYKRGDLTENFSKIKFVPKSILSSVEQDINLAFLTKYTTHKAFDLESKASIENNIKIKEIRFEINQYTEATLNTHNIKVEQFQSAVETERLLALWNKLFNIESQQVVAYLYRNYLLENIFFNSSQTFTLSILRNKLISGNLINHFKTINIESFKGYSFNYNHLFETKLSDKNTLLKRVADFGHERFVLSHNKHLGQGDFGTVYAAEDTFLHAPVAIKLIPHWFKSPDVSEKLVSEAISMRSCQHKNVTIVYDLILLNPQNFVFEGAKQDEIKSAFEEGELVYGLVMEQVANGTTLKDFTLTESWQKLSHTDKLNLYLDICAGVEKLHRAGLVHGDLKPENVLLQVGEDNSKPIVKITDFGLSCKVGQAGINKFNPVYSSIDRIKGEEPDKSDDIYSLGMLLLFVMGFEIEELFQSGDLIETLYEKYAFEFAVRGVFCKDEIVSSLLPDTSPFKTMKQMPEHLERIVTSEIKTLECRWPVAEKYQKYLSGIKDLSYQLKSEVEAQERDAYFYSIVADTLKSKSISNKTELKNIVGKLLGKNITKKALSEEFGYLVPFYNGKYDYSIARVMFDVSTFKDGQTDPQESDRTVTSLVYLGHIITDENIKSLCPELTLNELKEVVQGRLNDDYEVVYKDDSSIDNRAVWKIDGRLYLTSIDSPARYFLDTFALQKKRNQLTSHIYSSLFNVLIGIIDSGEISPWAIEQLYQHIEKIPTKGNTIANDIKQELENVHTLYQEVESVFDLKIKTMDSGIDDFIVPEPINSPANVAAFSDELGKIANDSDDNNSYAESNIMDSGVPHTAIKSDRCDDIVSNMSDYWRRVKENKLLSSKECENVASSVMAFVNKAETHSFGSFYSHCFETHTLLNMAVELGNKMREELDEYNQIKAWIHDQEQSLEYELFLKYSHSNLLEDITILSS